jgi:hypothetical protein
MLLHFLQSSQLKELSLGVGNMLPSPPPSPVHSTHDMCIMNFSTKNVFLKESVLADAFAVLHFMFKTF